mgnify:CR=1 FL=1
MPVDRSDDRVHRQADVFRHRQVVSADDLVVAAVHGDQELERRATSIVQALDDATLEAIAAGTLDMRAMCRQVADEIKQTA